MTGISPRRPEELPWCRGSAYRGGAKIGPEAEVASAYKALGAAARISAVARSEPSTRLADRFIIGINRLHHAAIIAEIR